MSNILIISNKEEYGILKLHFENLGHNVYLLSLNNLVYTPIQNVNPNIVLLNLDLPNLDSNDIIETIKKVDKTIQIIVFTSHFNLVSGIKAMQMGIFDFLQRPIDLEQLNIKVQKALEIQRMSQLLKSYIEIDSNEYNLNNILLGRTPIMKELSKIIGQLASNRVTTLIKGESGTGKELIAKIIHYSGVTHNEPFMAINCSAIPENLLESELFGHAKGSFTGAFRDKKGKFELASDGTVFLDEISELNLVMQAKLLRVLQEREFEKVGGDSTISFKARVLAATNKDLEKMVNEGKFREDLFFRLKVFSLNLPPLRERKADIPLMIIHFLKKHNSALHK